MRAFPQMVIYVVSLVTAFFVGQVFHTAFWQLSYHAGHLLGGKPLPAITEFFVDHDAFPIYLALLPWIGLAGLPLLTRASAKEYWNTEWFLLRFLAFVCCEVLLFLLLAFFLSLPFMTLYGAMRSSENGGALEVFLNLALWAGFVAIAVLGPWRWWQIRRGAVNVPIASLDRDGWD